MSWANKVSLNAQKPSMLEGELENIWLWGDARTGKSANIRANYPDAYIKPLNKWWDGY